MFDFVHTTITDNNATESIFKLAKNTNNTLPFLEIHSSIIDNPFIPVLTHDAASLTVNISHVISNEIGSLSNSTTINDAESFAGGSFIDFAPLFFQTPLFVDRANRNYHLTATSPAIDYAYTPSRTPHMSRDIDFEERGFDNSTRVDNYFLSYFDIGADELSETIFKDSFE